MHEVFGDAIVARSAHGGAAFFAPLRLCVKLILCGINSCILLRQMPLLHAAAGSDRSFLLRHGRCLHRPFIFPH